MIGLEYGSVRLEAHDPLWEAAFTEERPRLFKALERIQCQIEHVGSTAVSGLGAKPIIDIAIGLERGFLIAPIIEALEEIGYVYRGDAADEGGHIFVRESTARVRTHHVHVVEAGGPQWRSYLAFRDLLRRDPEARRRYEERKHELAVRHADDRRAYTAGKQHVIQELLATDRTPRT